MKWTPGNDSTSTVAVTQMTHTDHNGAYAESSAHNLLFAVTDNAACELAAGDAFNLFARVTTAPNSGSTVRALFYGETNYELEII